MPGIFDAIGSIITSGITSDAIKKQTAAQTAASQAATAAVTGANQQAQGAVSSAGDAARTAVLPYATTGSSALSKLAGLYGLADGGTITAGGISGGVNNGQTATGGISSGDPYAAYLAANPDIAAEEQRVVASGQPLPNGAPATEQNYLQWHDAQYGSEGRPSYQSAPQTGGQTVSNAQVSATPTSTSADPFASFYQSPDYNFKLGQGIAGVDAGGAARGMLDSGATRKAEITYAGNLASSQYDDYTNKLYQLAGLGQNATNTTAAADTAQGATSAGLATGLGTNLANIAANQGNNLASSYLAQGRNAAGVVNGVVGGLNSAASSYFGVPSGGGSNTAPANLVGTGGWGA